MSQALKNNPTPLPIDAQVIDLDGLPVTTGVVVTIKKDTGAFAVGAGTTTHKGAGAWEYVPIQDETNADTYTVVFTPPSGPPQLVEVFTTTVLLSQLETETAAASRASADAARDAITQGKIDAAAANDQTEHDDTQAAIAALNDFNPATEGVNVTLIEGVDATDQLDTHAGSGLTAADVWTHVTRTLTSPSGATTQDVEDARDAVITHGDTTGAWGAVTTIPDLTQLFDAATEFQGMTGPPGVFTGAALANAPTGGGSFDPDANEIVPGITWTEWARIVGATTASKLSGAGTSTEVFRGLDDTSNVVTATVDALGNRTAVVFNP